MSQRASSHSLSTRCAWCYSEATALEGATPKLLRCGKCKKRSYCSKACQLNDWKGGAHKQWCGASGELGHDIIVCPAEGKGIAMFSTRAFARGEKIMVERVSATKREASEALADVTDGMRNAAADLMPRTTVDLESKFALNSFEMNDGSEGLFIHMAYANHACLPNAVHHSVLPAGLKILVASRDIEPGEEICHRYVTLEGEARLARSGKTLSSFLQDVWGFQCTCAACTIPDVRAKVARMCELDSAIVACTATDVREPDGPRRFDEALQLGADLIALYDDLRVSPTLYARTYHVLFQLGVTRRATLALARKHIELAWENQRLFVGCDTVCPEVSRFAALMRKPESHNAYLAGE